MTQQSENVSSDTAIGWLTRNLGGAACIAYEAGPSPTSLLRKEENTEVRFEGCRMLLQQAAVDGSRSEVRTFDVRLGTLTANSIAAREWGSLPPTWTIRGDLPTHVISLVVPDGQPPIEVKVETFDGRGTTTAQTRTVDLLVRLPGNATPFVQSLQRAIEGCR